MKNGKKKKSIPFSPTLDEEVRLGYPRMWIAGADEVGRGCLAGPVVAAAIILPEMIDFERDSWLKEIQDSKLLTPEARESLSPKICQWANAVAIGVATVEEIDRINIFHASHLAIVRAVHSLSSPKNAIVSQGKIPHHVLIDGKFLPSPKQLGIPATALIKGDQKSLSIAAASIVAKVWRDEHMGHLDQIYPGYGLAQHKGYPTPAHALAIKERGILNIHRRSFKTVSAQLA